MFSPNSKSLAYTIKRNGKIVPVLDGFEGNEYDQFLAPETRLEAFPSPTAFRFDERGVLHAVAVRGNELLGLELRVVSK